MFLPPELVKTILLKIIFNFRNGSNRIWTRTLWRTKDRTIWLTIAGNWRWLDTSVKHPRSVLYQGLENMCFGVRILVELLIFTSFSDDLPDRMVNLWGQSGMAFAGHNGQGMTFADTQIRSLRARKYWYILQTSLSPHLCHGDSYGYRSVLHIVMSTNFACRWCAPCCRCIVNTSKGSTTMIKCGPCRFSRAS